MLALKKAQEQPPVNANAELTLRKKLNAAKKKKNGKGNTPSKDDEETPEQDDDGGQGSSTDKAKRNDTSSTQQAGTSSNKSKTKTGEKKQKNVFDLATAKKNSVPKKSPKKKLVCFNAKMF